MAWIKIPQDHHPILVAALPKDPRVRTLQMFGGTAALVNGNMFGGTFARSAIVRLAPDDQAEALALDGAEPFDPMGNGRVMANTVLLPESVMDEPEELKRWLARALEHTATLPPKHKKGRTTKTKASAKKSTPKQTARRKRSKPARRAATGKTRARKKR